MLFWEHLITALLCPANNMVCIFEQYRLPAARTRTIITVVRWHFLKCFRKSPSSFSMSFFLNLHNLSLAMRFFLREGNARQTAALIDHLSVSIFADHPSPPSFSTSPPPQSFHIIPPKLHCLRTTNYCYRRL